MSSVRAVLGTTWNTTTGSHTVVATPSAGDLVVIVCANTGITTNPTVSDNNSDGLGAYTQIVGALKNTSADKAFIYIRNAKVGSASSTTFTVTGASSTGGGLCVLALSNVDQLGSAAARQSASQANQASGGTPTPVFGSAALSRNIVIGAVFNATNPAGMTPRGTPAYTERADVGYNTPASGLEVMTIDTGETGTSIAWGGTSGSAFCSMAVEIDCTRLNTPSGTFSSSGALTKKPALASLAGALTTAGALAKRAGKALAGAFSGAGALTAFRLVLLSLAGAFSGAGALVKQTQRPGAGTLVSDTFTDTNGTNLTSHTPEVGGSWTVVSSGSGAFDIQSNKANVSTAASRLVAYQDTGKTDATVTVDGVCVTYFNACSAVLRLTAQDAHWLASFYVSNVAGASGFQIVEVTGGTSTTRASVALTLSLSTPYTIVFSVSGDNFTATLNGANTLTYTSSVRNTATRHGIGATGLAHTLDNALISYTVTSPIAGALTTAGALAKSTAHALAGSWSGAGALTALRQVLLTVTGALSTAGALARQTGKAAAGTLTSAGALTKATTKAAFTGTLSTAGTLTRAARASMAGALTTAGALTRQAQKAASGTLSSAGGLARQAQKTAAGALSTAGTLARQTGKALSGALSTAGDLTRKTLTALAGAFSSAGALTPLKLGGSLFLQSVAGTLTTAGELVRQTGKVTGGALSEAGAVTKAIVLSAFSGTLSTAGAVSRQAQHALGGTLSTAGSLARQVWKAVAGALTAAGSLATQWISGGPQVFYQAVSGALTTASTLTRETARTLTGALGMTGTLAGVIAQYRMLRVWARDLLLSIVARSTRIAVRSRAVTVATRTVAVTVSARGALTVEAHDYE